MLACASFRASSCKATQLEVTRRASTKSALVGSPGNGSVAGGGGKRETGVDTDVDAIGVGARDAGEWAGPQLARCVAAMMGSKSATMRADVMIEDFGGGGRELLSGGSDCDPARMFPEPALSWDRAQRSLVCMKTHELKTRVFMSFAASAFAFACSGVGCGSDESESPVPGPGTEGGAGTSGHAGAAAAAGHAGAAGAAGHAGAAGTGGSAGVGGALGQAGAAADAGPHPDASPDAPGPSNPITWEDSNDGIHAFMTFDYKIAPADVPSAAQHNSYVWGAAEGNIAAYRSSSNPKIVLSYYMPYTRDPVSRDNALAYWQGFHPDWVLYLCDQQTPAYEFNDPNVPLDISNPAVIDWQVQSNAAPMSAKGYDAVAADNYSLNNDWQACGVFDQNGQWKQLYSGQVSDPQYTNDVLAWTHAFSQKLHALPQPMGLIPNFQTSDLNDANVVAAVKDFDGVLNECGFTGCGSSYATGSKWLAIQTFAEYLQAQGKAYFSINELDSGIDQNTIQWVLASYLMSKEHASGIFISGVQEYGSDLWHDEYGAAIGTPCGAMQSSQGAYMREFTHGIAIANPSTSDASFTLPAGSFTDLYGQSRSGSVSLGATSGIVLLDTGGPRC